MNQHQLKACFAQNTRVYGTMIASPSPRWVEVVRQLGVDFVFIDSEHIPLDRTQIAWMCQAYSAIGVAPIVRIPSPDPYEACMAMDGGAAGIVAPYIETREQVNAIRGAVKYRPLKGKRLHDVLEGREQLTADEAAFFKGYNDGSLLILNIESRHAVEHLDGLLSVPDVDAVFIGPHDLSISLGAPEHYDTPAFAQSVRQIIVACRARGLGVGNHFSVDIEKQVEWVGLGMNIVVWNSDMLRFAQVMAEDIALLRMRLGDQLTAEKGKSLYT